MTILPHCTAKAQEFLHFLGTVADELAIQTRAVQSKRAKLTGSQMAQSLVLSCWDNPNSSLRDLAQMSAELGLSVTPVAWHYRLNQPTRRFLEALLAQALQAQTQHSTLPPTVLNAFTQVRLVDSTLMELPDRLAHEFAGQRLNSPAALKLQVCLDYLSGRIEAIQLTAGRAPDQHCPLPLQGAKGSLTVFDLGYFSQELLANFGDERYFLSRLQTQTAVYEHANASQRLDLGAFLRQAPPEGEVSVYLGQKRRVPVRLIYHRLPKTVVAERRRKAHDKARRQGRTCSQETLALLDWSLYITNAPVEALPMTVIADVYRVRWQIECLFKLWKHSAQLDVFGSWRPERVLCQLYARLIGLVWFQTFALPYRFDDHDHALSFTKAYQTLCKRVLALMEAVKQGQAALERVLQSLVCIWLRYDQQSQHRKTPSTLDTIRIAS